MTTILGLPANVVYFTAGIYALLALATIVVLVLRWRNPGERYAELMARTDSWWWMIGAFTLAILLNQTVAIVFLALIAYLALKEYLSLVPTRRIDREVLLFAHLAIPLQFYWAAIDWYNMFIVFVPVWMFLFFPALMALRGQTQGFLRAVGTLSWGLMMTVYTLSHMAWLLVSGDRINPLAGGVGLLFFLVVLTQFNDVSQYCWGKPLGRHKVTPNVSPKKTWEGLIGGIATTTLVAGLVGPYLTPMDWRWSALAGAILGVSGFLGDITMSAMKRDLGVKDTGGLIRAMAASSTASTALLTRHRCSSTSSAISISRDEAMSKNPFTRLLRFLFFAVVVRAVILIALGLTVRHRERLPKDGPAVLAGNHNSNLDALAIMSLMPLRLLPKLRPVAAMDYFFTSSIRGWFATNIIGIIPVKRGSGKEGGNPLLLAEQALERGEILVLFPEGTRGEPETFKEFKKGIGHLAHALPKVPVVPIFMYGLGKALPKGSALLVPFNVTVSVGEPLYGTPSYSEFVSKLQRSMTDLAAQEKLPVWE